MSGFRKDRKREEMAWDNMYLKGNQWDMGVETKTEEESKQNLFFLNSMLS